MRLQWDKQSASRVIKTQTLAYTGSRTVVSNSGHWTDAFALCQKQPLLAALCQRFDDANVALGGVAQHLQCGLIAGPVVGGDGFLHAVEFD
jgi:hypothetical protein